ncbi:MAG: hypothetical protein GY772_13985 [bacterium]|nr:hypothetical protein [bacterium]
MAALGYEDTRGDGELASPGSASKVRQRRRAARPTVEAPVKLSMAAKAPELHLEEKAAVEVVVLNSAQQRWLNVESLPWLLEFLRDQTASGGVAAVPPRSDAGRPRTAPDPGISWDFRDDAWVAVTENQERRAIYVRKRTRTEGDPLFAMDWEAAKSQAYAELLAWRGDGATSAVAESSRKKASRSSGRRLEKS